MLRELLLHKTTSASPAGVQSSPKDPSFLSKEGGRGRPWCPSRLPMHPLRGQILGEGREPRLLWAHRGISVSEAVGFCSVSGKLGALGSQKDSVQSWMDKSSPTPCRGAERHRQGTALLLPHSQRDGCWGGGRGEQPVAGQAGVSFVGLQSHVLNFPSSLLPLHLTHADPPSPPGSPHSHEPQHSFCDWTGKYS